MLVLSFMEGMLLLARSQADTGCARVSKDAPSWRQRKTLDG